MRAPGVTSGVDQFGQGQFGDQRSLAQPGLDQALHLGFRQGRGMGDAGRGAQQPRPPRPPRAPSRRCRPLSGTRICTVSLSASPARQPSEARSASSEAPSASAARNAITPITMSSGAAPSRAAEDPLVALMRAPEVDQPPVHQPHLARLGALDQRARSWVAISTVVPSRFNSPNSRISRAPISGSTLPVGSSAIRRSGFPTTARAIAMRCCSRPKASAGANACGRRDRPRTEVLHVVLVVVLAGQLQRQRDIVEGGEMIEQAESWNTTPDAPADGGKIATPRRRHIVA